MPPPYGLSSSPRTKFRPNPPPYQSERAQDGSTADQRTYFATLYDLYDESASGKERRRTEVGGTLYADGGELS